MLLETPVKSCTEQPAGMLQPANLRPSEVRPPGSTLCRTSAANCLERLIKWVCILYPPEELTQLSPGSSTPFKYTVLGSLDPVQASALPVHRKLGLKHSLGTVWLKDIEINEAVKSLLDINACDGSSCQLEPLCLVLFL